MSVSALVCLAPGSEELEAVTAIDLLVRAGVEVTTASVAGVEVTTASVAGDGNLEIRCSRGVKILADVALVDVADREFDVIVLPGGVKGAECFRDSPLLVEKVRHVNVTGKLVAAICAAPALVLEFHDLFPVGNMTGFPSLKDKISPNKWMEKRVMFDPRVNLLTSQGPGTAIEFALKMIDLLIGKEKAAEVAGQLVLYPGIHNYQD